MYLKRQKKCASWFHLVEDDNDLYYNQPQGCKQDVCELNYSKCSYVVAAVAIDGNNRVSIMFWNAEKTQLQNDCAAGWVMLCISSSQSVQEAGPLRHGSSHITQGFLWGDSPISQNCGSKNFWVTRSAFDLDAIGPLVGLLYHTIGSHFLLRNISCNLQMQKVFPLKFCRICLFGSPKAPSSVSVKTLWEFY